MAKHIFNTHLILILIFANSNLLNAQIKNPSFESNKILNTSKKLQKLKGWKITKGNIKLISQNVFAAANGNQVLDLNGDQPGAIKQTIKGLKKNTAYTLKFEYADQKERKQEGAATLATGILIINNKKVATLRNLSKAPNYIEGIGFPFQSSSNGKAIIEFISTTPGNKGLVIDNLRIEEGLPQIPPKNKYLTNGSFELKVDNNSKNPHLSANQLPGWLIMRENIDLIAIDKFGTPDGKWIIDLGGHGPGSIAQTIVGLTPNAKYRLSMLYSRHIHWNQQESLTAEIFINNKLILSLDRNQLKKAPRWEKITHEFTVPNNGEVTLSMFSTAYKLGGGILFDDIKIEKISDILPLKKIPVLIVDGFSNHNWQLNTSYIKEILETSGKFDVSVSTCPNQLKNKSLWESWNPDFKKYPVIIQTCNNISNKDLQWPDTVKQSFEKYVANGGGVYIYHGANNAFKNWNAYNKIIGLGWRNKNFGLAYTIDENEKLIVIPKGDGESTRHGKRLDVLITRINNHPIHKGMPKSWLASDIEVYRYARGISNNLQVISYGKEAKTGLNFPIEWVVKYKNGKAYSSTYGHLWHNQKSPAGMRCAAFQQSMVRALQWLSNNNIDNYVDMDFPNDKNIILRKPFKN